MKNMINKKLVIVIALIVLLVLILVPSFFKETKPLENLSTNDFEVKYENSNTIELSKLKNGTVYTNNIVVTNKSDKDITYSISWINVNNNFKEQNKLLYDLNTMDQDAGFLSKSQIPVVDSHVFDKITIRKGLTHKYTLSVYFEGDSNKESESVFKGTIDIKETNK